MATLGVTSVTSITSATAASAPTQLVRKQEFDAALSSTASGVHTHPSTQITDFTEAAQDAVAGAFTDTQSVALVYDDGANQISGNVRLKAGGNIAVGPDGLYASGLAPYGYIPSGIHSPVTLTPSNSLDWSIDVNQVHSAEVRLRPNPGLNITPSGLSCDFGGSHFQVPYGDHTHSGLHNKVTVQNSATVALSIPNGDQLIQADVRLHPSPAPGGALIKNDSQGIYAYVGPSGVAAYAHTHAVATSAADGFMSAADKVKLDQYGPLLQLNGPVLYHRPDFLIQGDYVGGKKRWNQRMRVTHANVTARAPLMAMTLSLEVNGVLTGDNLTLPAGLAPSESSGTVTLGATYIETMEYARWYCSSGVPAASGVENAAALVNVEMNVEPALTAPPTVRLNAGGSATGSWSADAYYDAGSPGNVGNAIDVTAVTDPAPQAVYQAWRAKYSDAYPITWTIPGLGKGVDYNVRLHFSENYHNNPGDQVMKLEVLGATTQTLASYDIRSTAGAKFKADIRAFTLRADTAGRIRVRITPLAGTGGLYNCSLNGIEILPV